MRDVQRKWLGGHVRKGIFIIRRRVHGKQYEVSTRCTTERAALKQLEIFEKDPEAYGKGVVASPDALYLTEALGQEFMDYMKAKGNGLEWRIIQKRFLLWWKDKLTNRNLCAVTSADVRNSLQKVTCYKHRLAVIKAFFTWLRENKNVVLATTLEDIPSPKSTPAQWAKSKIIPSVDAEAVMPFLLPHYQWAVTVQAGTGWHVTETIRFAHGGEIARKLPIPFAGGVLTCPLHKNGAPKKSIVSEDVIHAACLLLKSHKLNNYNPYYKALTKACIKAGVGHFCPGYFRHTTASYAIEQGATPEQVAAYLGHKDKRTTMRLYATHAIVPKIPTLK